MRIFLPREKTENIFTYIYTVNVLLFWTGPRFNCDRIIYFRGCRWTSFRQRNGHPSCKPITDHFRRFLNRYNIVLILFMLSYRLFAFFFYAMFVWNPNVACRKVNAIIRSTITVLMFGNIFSQTRIEQYAVGFSFKSITMEYISCTGLKNGFFRFAVIHVLILNSNYTLHECRCPFSFYIHRINEKDNM